MSGGHIPLQVAGPAGGSSRYYRVTGTLLTIFPGPDGGWRVHAPTPHLDWTSRCGLHGVTFPTRQAAARAAVAQLAAHPLPGLPMPRFTHGSARLRRVAAGRHEAFGGAVILIRADGDGPYWKATSAADGATLNTYATLRHAADRLPYDTPAELIPQDWPA